MDDAFITNVLQYTTLCIDVRENVGNRDNRHMFGNTVKRRHLITKQDVANMRRKVCDQTFMRHLDDATSVQMIVK